MTIFSRLIDERFLSHRRRSTAIAGQAGGALALGLFAWNFYAHHIWSWDLLAVSASMGLVKVGLLAWYLMHD